MTGKSVPTRLSVEQRRNRRKQMCLAVVAGLAYAQVAAQFGVTEQTVRSACKEFATPKRRGAK